MDPLRMEIARQHLRQTSHGKLGGRKRRGGGPRPDARGRTGDQNRTAAAGEHLRHDLPRPQECAERVQPPRLLEHLGRRLQQAAHRTAPAVVYENLNRTQFAPDLFVRGRDLLFESRVTLDWKRDTACRSELIRNLFDDVRASGDQRDLIAYREPAGQSRAQTSPDADNRRYTPLDLRCHHTTLAFSSTNINSPIDARDFTPPWASEASPLMNSASAD